MNKPIYLLLLLLLSSCQSVFFFPSKTLVQTPTDLGIKYEDHFLEVVPDTKINMWELLPEGEEKGVVLFLHGNAENISTHIMAVSWMSAMGYRVYAFDYEGFGLSEGSESVDHSIRDAKAVFNFIENRNKGSHLIIVGQSIGGAIALFAFKDPEYRNKINAFIVDSTFTSYQSIAKERLASSGFIFPFPALISYLATTCCNPIDAIGEYGSSRMLFLHDELDPIVAKTNSDQLFNKLPEGRKEFWLQSEGHHIGFFSKLENRNKFLEYLQQGSK